jgi:hypothetical protein
LNKKAELMAFNDINNRLLKVEGVLVDEGDLDSL